MEKIKKAFGSRTFWTIVVMFIIGGVEGIREVLPPQSLVFVQGGLGLLATYFKINPSQNYNE